MIQNIWIVEKDKGQCLFHKRFGKIDVDPDLFSAFLTGLYGFAETELGEKKGIDSIEMGNLKWVYMYSHDLLFIIAGEKDDPVPHLKAKLNIIKSNFFAEFPIFTKDWQEAFKHTGSKSIYDQFHPIVDELVADWIQLAEITIAATFMDICEVCQQIVSLLCKIISSCGEERKQAFLDSLKQQISDLIKNNGELSKILTENGAIDILRVNVFKLTENEVELLKELVKQSANILQNELGYTTFQAMFRKMLIPYLKIDWTRIRSLGFDNLLIDLL
ncbi:MAG: hypothetical protein ACFFCD_15545 [Promethearchaeota archaeon]